MTTLLIQPSLDKKRSHDEYNDVGLAKALDGMNTRRLLFAMLQVFSYVFSSSSAYWIDMLTALA